jgi:hypothetical protein
VLGAGLTAFFSGAECSYDKLGAPFFAFIKIAAVRIWLRSIESKARNAPTLNR